jgi:hypothetical protein
VYQSNLLDPDDVPGWAKTGHSACPSMLWLSQHAAAGACQAMTTANSACTAPKTAIYQSGPPHNCYCANASCSILVKSAWLDVFVKRGAPAAPWTKTSHTACKLTEMLWVGDAGSALACQATVVGAQGCAMVPTRTAFWQSGAPHDCYCQNSTICTQSNSDRLDRYTEPAPPHIPATLTSTGKMYTLK